jgi:hypothetical protein
MKPKASEGQPRATNGNTLLAADRDGADRGGIHLDEIADARLSLSMVNPPKRHAVA